MNGQSVQWIWTVIRPFVPSNRATYLEIIKHIYLLKHIFNIILSNLYKHNLFLKIHNIYWDKTKKDELFYTLFRWDGQPISVLPAASTLLCWYLLKFICSHSQQGADMTADGRWAMADGRWPTADPMIDLCNRDSKHTLVPFHCLQIFTSGGYFCWLDDMINWCSFKMIRWKWCFPF